VLGKSKCSTASASQADKACTRLTLVLKQLLKNKPWSVTWHISRAAQLNTIKLEDNQLNVPLSRRSKYSAAFINVVIFFTILCNRRLILKLTIFTNTSDHITINSCVIIIEGRVAVRSCRTSALGLRKRKLIFDIEYLNDCCSARLLFVNQSIDQNNCICRHVARDYEAHKPERVFVHFHCDKQIEGILVLHAHAIHCQRSSGRCNESALWTHGRKSCWYLYRIV